MWNLSNYGPIFSHYGDIQRERMGWPWNLGLRSFNVIENGAAQQTIYDFLLVRHCNYSCILYLVLFVSLLPFSFLSIKSTTTIFWVIWRWIILWPWNLAKKSLEVIEANTIRKLGCGFLFAFHNSYDATLYHLRDIATCWSKIGNFFLYLACI